MFFIFMSWMPLLDAVETRALRQVHEQREV
jgi:hypothetical protein